MHLDAPSVQHGHSVDAARLSIDVVVVSSPARIDV